ncbi:MAG TPA: ThiF family adenylyltransferase [Candidatus Acidoferrum sp.]|nr:ThiF family adenylyltransferase [Candidatus Acidoferrum sp.]
MSQRPISRSPDLKKLRDEGYDLEVRSGCLLVKDLPYVTSRKEVKRGILVIKLVLADDETGRPDTHVAYFSGEHPCNEDGAEIAKIKHGSGQLSLAEGVIVHHSFSAKPKPNDCYPDYYEQVTTYVAIISGPAWRIDSTATAKTFPLVEPENEDDEPFNYIDTASSRAEIVAVTKKLALKSVAILGLGGTGSYVLDLVAKTPVRQIHLYDGDIFLQHNAFRSPSAPSGDELRAKQPKVTYFKNLYGKMHRGIVDHPVYVDASSAEELRGMDFVFICMDKGGPKKAIVEKLEELNIPFTDAGMGVQLNDNALGGIVRVTTSTAKMREHFRSRVSFEDAPGDDDYNRNIQIADLNALNAALAVIKWKKLCGFYRDLKAEHHSQFSIDTNLLLNEDRLP